MSLFCFVFHFQYMLKSYVLLLLLPPHYTYSNEKKSKMRWFIDASKVKFKAFPNEPNLWWDYHEINWNNISQSPLVYLVSSRYTYFSLFHSIIYYTTYRLHMYLYVPQTYVAYIFILIIDGHGVDPCMTSKNCPTPGVKKNRGGCTPGCEAPRKKKFLTPRWGHFFHFFGKITPRSTK